MKHMWMLFLCLTITIKLAYSESYECVNGRTWQIGYTMYENYWHRNDLSVYARCIDSSHVLSPGASNWNLCKSGKLEKGLPRCQQESEQIFNCDVGNKWHDDFTKYEVISSGEKLYVLAACTKEEFIIDRDASSIRCDNHTSNRVLPQCRKGEVKNTFEACATGRRSRSENYEFQNMWHNGALFVRVFCIHEGTETRSDIILCENGKMKRTPTIDFCKIRQEIQEHDDKACILGKKWTANDTEYEISSIGRSLMVIGKCIKPGFHIAHYSRKLCESGRIPEVLPQCKEKSHEDACFSGKKWTANDTVYEISSYGNGFVIYIKCKDPSIFRIIGAMWKLCEQGRIPSELPHCKATTPITSNCHLANGGCDHICNNLNGTVQCSCNEGYELHWNNKTCIDIDECANNTTNKCHHQCINTEGSFKCSCHSGYVLINDFKCEVENLLDACAIGRRSRNDDYEFEYVWHHGAPHVRVFCIHEGIETRSDTIPCENGKMKRTPPIDFCYEPYFWK